MKKIDLSGKKFNDLLVLHQAENQEMVIWVCQCICGKITLATSYQLNSGHKKSCGCLIIRQGAEKAKLMNKAWTKRSPKERSAQAVWKCRYDDGDLTLEEFMFLSQSNCIYCGSEPFNSQNAPARDSRSAKKSIEEGEFVYNGLDRVDSELPHDLGNVVACCKRCNWAKRNFKLEEFLEWIIRFAD